MRHDGKQHFSHKHMLIPIEPEADDEAIKCEACDRMIEKLFYGCLSCGFFLHTTCFDAPRYLQHPSHPSHPLALFQTPTYPYRSCHCDACGLEVNSFSYACAQCEFDLHLHCATAPRTLLTEGEHPNAQGRPKGKVGEAALGL